MERKKEDCHLHRAIIDGDVNKVGRLVQKLPDLNPLVILKVMSCYSDLRSHPEGKNITPLFAAILTSEIKICKYLIDEGADVNWGYLDGMTPLCLALHQKLYNVAEFLIEKGANILVLDRMNRAPIYLAIQEDSPVSIVKTILLAGFPKDAVTVDDGKRKSKLLGRAISVKNIPVVKFLLEQNVDINSLVDVGTTLMMLAVSSMSPDIIKLLIDNGANVEGIAKNDTPPLFLAVHLEDTTVLKILLNAGADVNRVFTPMAYFHHTGLQLPLITAIEIAAMNCCIEVTKVLLDHGASSNTINPLLKGTPLHLMSARVIENLNKKDKDSLRKVVQYFLENGADLSVKDIEGKSPILVALSSKNWIALEEFIKFGINLNEPLSSKDGSVLRFVIRNKEDNLVEQCLAHGASCFQKFRGDPIYNDTLKSNRPNFLKLFWKHFYPFDAVPEEKSLKNSPKVLCLFKTQLLFKKSILNNDPESVEKALKEGAEVNCHTKDLQGFPLHFCSARGDSELVKILLENGAKISILNNTGYTAIHEAARAGHIDICGLLLAHGACYNGRGPGGATPQQLAQSAGHTEVVHFLKNVSKHFSSLKKKNETTVDNIKKELGSGNFHAYMNCVNHRGNTLLGEALRLNLINISEKLMFLRLNTV